MGGKFILPFGLWLMRHTMLGNPLIKPWQDLAAVTDNFEMEQFLFGSWYVRKSISPTGITGFYPFYWLLRCSFAKAQLTG